MENSPPQSFINFLKAILDAEIQSDSWKSKLFYQSSDQIINLFIKEKQASQQNINILTLQQLVRFIRQNSQQKISLDEQDQKVICKYFGFEEYYKCQINHFLKKLKPINNKLIAGLQKSQIEVKATMFKLLKSILDGYKKSKEKRRVCNTECSKIIQFFKNSLDCQCLTKESLKQFMYEADLYGRINYNYLNQYIFGQNQEKIEWSVLFKKAIIMTDQIQQLSEEQIVSEQCISQKIVEIKQNFLNPSQEQLKYDPINFLKQQDHDKSLFLQSVSQIRGSSEPVSLKQLTPSDHDYSKVLSQISYIETLLNKTKQKYQKNRQQLENQTKQIRSIQLKRSQSGSKFSRKPINDYTSLKIQEQRPQVQIKRFERKIVEKLQKQSKQPGQLSSKIQTNLSVQEHMEQSNIKPYISREAMKKEIQQEISQKYQVPKCIHRDGQRREIGKIKRRSVSKDIQKKQTQNRKLYQPYQDLKKMKTFSTQNLDIKSKNNAKDYSQYQAVLRQIQKQQKEYQRIVEQRQKIVYEKQMKKKLNLDVRNSSLKKYTPVNSFVTDKQTFTHLKRDTHTKNLSENTFSEIMKQISNNTLSRSRISSKKRDQIVQKATSQARLRIQEIQNRALNRLAKLDVENSEKLGKKKNFYLNLTQTEKQQNTNYKARYNAENSKQKNTLEVRSKFFMNDLLNERPSLKISTSNLNSFNSRKF